MAETYRLANTLNSYFSFAGVAGGADNAVGVAAAGEEAGRQGGSQPQGRHICQ